MNRYRYDLYIIRKFEGLRLRPYLCPAGYATIGYGHRIMTEREATAFSKGISFNDAEKILKDDVEKFRWQIQKLIADLDYTEGQLQALTSFAFNVGVGALTSSTLLRKFRRGNIPGAGDEFFKWVWSGNLRLKGLEFRRVFESQLFLTGSVDTIDNRKMS